MANLTNPTEYRRPTFAQNALLVVDNTFVQPAGEEYVAGYCIPNTTNTVLTTANGDDLDGRDLQQGMIIYGNITAVSTGTGELIAYIK